ncbi:MAG: nitroreductase family deazaflavin-dependent oxidoreductase [Chloroflexi bacterium]|nr:nitroreductase family deazaflavin-dependent oxidoreductase [Chloroflexota bacterium]MCC6893404.1 nitroreductase family deazaflavin-dependent oxidoreductase [Anaerolineae bacterium]
MLKPVRYFNKYILNRVLRWLAYAPFGPFALVKHVGRKSGKPYETTIMAFPIEGGFMIALTYGPEVDWYKNVQAAGGCTLFFHRKEYAINHLEPMEPDAALPLFPQPQKTILQSMGLVKNFVKMLTV